MAKRTETTPETGAPPPIGPPSPWPSPPEERHPRLGWAALAFVLVVAAVFGGWLVFGHKTQHHQATPGTSASRPSTAGAPSLPAPVPATTYEAFAALTSDQKQAVMQQVVSRYDAALDQAYRTLDGSLLPLVATGDQLAVVQKDFNSVKQAGYPLSEQDQVTILEVVMSPQPFTFVSVHIQSTGVDQYLDPKTLQPVGTPQSSTGTSSFSFVIQDGTWVASEHFQDINK